MTSHTDMVFIHLITLYMSHSKYMFVSLCVSWSVSICSCDSVFPVHPMKLAYTAYWHTIYIGTCSDCFQQLKNGQW